jgi:hypothetical protein
MRGLDSRSAAVAYGGLRGINPARILTKINVKGD